MSAFAAFTRRLQLVRSAHRLAAVERDLLHAGRSAANPPATAAAVYRDRRTFGCYVDAAALTMRGVSVI